MKGKHFSMPGEAARHGHGDGGPHKGSHKRQHHDGHSMGHPTEHGLGENPLPNVSFGGPDYGSMAEHGLSEGNVRAVVNALPVTQCNNSLLKNHGLQHVNYASMTGNNAVDPEYGREGEKGDYPDYEKL